MSTGGFRREPGDWSCTSCNEVNFKSRIACRRCSTPRGTGTSAAQIVPRPGDWSCRSCNNVNFASRTSCHQCGAAKTEATEINARPAVTPKPGDWKCGSCPEMNFGSRVVCRTCGAARPNASAPAGGEASRDKKDECVICMENSIDSVITSCGHSAMCLNCGSQLTQCPICRSTFSRNELIKLFNVH